jgi:hypothetical protein
MEGFRKNGRRSVDRARLYTLTILGDDIPSNAFNYEVNCDLIKLKLHWNLTEHWNSLLLQSLKVNVHRLKGVYAILSRLS